MRVALEINRQTYEADVEPRLLLADFIRERAGLRGTHLGCEHGICGACTVQLDGRPVRSCLVLAIQAQGHAVRTVEAMGDESCLHPLQAAFRECHALQCGFCTPGFLMSLEPLLPELADASDAEIRAALAGNLCRCTGYESIVEAVRRACTRLADTPGGSNEEAT